MSTKSTPTSTSTSKPNTAKQQQQQQESSSIKKPFINEEIISFPTQRIYIVSFFIVAQAWKFTAFDSFFQFISIDALLLLVIIPFFRVPLLLNTWRSCFAALILCFLIDLALTSSWTFYDLFNALPPVAWFRSAWLDRAWAITERRVRISDVIHPSAYILGRHTIHVLPHATAKLNPSEQCFCIDPASSSKSQVTVPIIFNNTKPHVLSYSVADFKTGIKRFHNITSTQLVPSSTSANAARVNEEEEEDWEWSGKWHSKKSAQKNLQDGQYVFSLQVRDVGVVRLERVLDKDEMDVRLYKREALVVECPRATFKSSSPSSSKSKHHHNEPCVGQSESLNLTVHGLAPLSLTYQSVLGGSSSSSPMSRKYAHQTATTKTLPSISNPDFSSPLYNHAITDPATNTIAMNNLGELSDYSWAAAQDVGLHINFSYTEPGIHTYTLSEVKDACGNRLNFDNIRESGARLPHGIIDQYSTRCHLRSTISFDSCSLENPIQKLRDEPAKIGVRIRQGDDSPWVVKTRYTPNMDLASRHNKHDVAPKYVDYTLSSGSNFIYAKEPGFYEILGIQGSHCPGDILVPSACSVIEQPLPSADISFTPVTDDCAGEVGLKAHMVLSGAPPFRLKYKVLFNGAVYDHGVKVIHNSHDEQTFEPRDYGKFEYIYTDLADSKYDFGKVKLDYKAKQTVHPLAMAKFISSSQENKLWSCEGDTVPVDVDLHGVGPYSFDYMTSARGQSVRETFSVSNVTSSPYRLDVPLPPKIAEKGGQISLSLVNIKDGRGCRRLLSVPDLYVDVHRSKPTASFYSRDGNQASVVVRADEQVKLPLRLTGVAPWTITYANDRDNVPQTTTIYSANGEIIVDKQGVYEILSVSDNHCPGLVNKDSNTFSIDWLPKPKLALSSDVGQINKQGVIIRQPVCQGTPDGFDLMLQGNGPFIVNYDISTGGNQYMVSHRALQVVANYLRFPLTTNHAGRTTYTFTGIGDSVYSDPSSDGILGIGQQNEQGELVSSPDYDLGGGGIFGSSGSKSNQVIKLEQDIHALPDGWIEKRFEQIYCIGDSFKDFLPLPNLVLNLEGEAPFNVILGVSDGTAQNLQKFAIEGIKEKVWPIKLPFELESIGRQEISLEQVQDGHSCINNNPTSSKGSSKQTIQVAEVGSIVPIQPQFDHCVGDTVDFLLQGEAPWTVKYKFNGKQQTVVAHHSKFSRVAESPGEFSILSVAHRENSCPSKPVELTKFIHPLPRVSISQGQKIVEDIREGEQTQITFNFEGTPPFAFTYTRSDWRSNKILETHTVTDVSEYSHTIFASTAGTYSVTFVSDRYCSFPPARKVDPYVSEGL